MTSRLCSPGIGRALRRCTAQPHHFGTQLCHSFGQRGQLHSGHDVRKLHRKDLSASQMPHIVLDVDGAELHRPASWA